MFGLGQLSIEWFTYDVPLWAFLLALGTDPLTWANKTSEIAIAVADRIISRVQSNSDSTESDEEV